MLKKRRFLFFFLFSFLEGERRGFKERERGARTKKPRGNKENSTSTPFFSFQKNKKLLTTKQGDLAKLGLAVLSMGYNVVILVQHYSTFAGRAAPESESASASRSTSPLLGNGAGADEEDGDEGERV